MDEKFTKRFESFQNSLHSLQEARVRDLTDSFVLSGTSAKFSITFDLSWKVMKDILVQYYAITGFVTSPDKSLMPLLLLFQTGLPFLCFALDRPDNSLAN